MDRISFLSAVTVLDKKSNKNFDIYNLRFRILSATWLWSPSLTRTRFNWTTANITRCLCTLMSNLLSPVVIDEKAIVVVSSAKLLSLENSNGSKMELPRDISLPLSRGQTIATCQLNIPQHCLTQYVACVWPACCDVLGVICSSLKIVKIWPNARNMLRSTMLRYVALTCSKCDRLVGDLGLCKALLPQATEEGKRSNQGARTFLNNMDAFGHRECFSSFSQLTFKLPVRRARALSEVRCKNCLSACHLLWGNRTR